MHRIKHPRCEDSALNFEGDNIEIFTFCKRTLFYLAHDDYTWVPWWVYPGMQLNSTTSTLSLPPQRKTGRKYDAKG